ncbi:unnamed protein product [Caenorhabditis sp. 36 PRJEB53466]|nr:unnamed protein product [Caenorhabditis sp. 36 PRJEB53466]
MEQIKIDGLEDFSRKRESSNRKNRFGEEQKSAEVDINAFFDDNTMSSSSLNDDLSALDSPDSAPSEND